MALPISGTVNDNQAGILRPRKTATPLIINGDMAIAQRGTSETGITGSGYYTIDRIRTGLSSLGTWTQSQSTDVPTGQGFSNSLKLDCTTADASPASSDYKLLQIRNEGQNFQVLKQGTSSAESMTVAFWVKSSKTGTYTFELEKIDSSRSISQTYTIDSANTWEKKVLSFAGDTTGTLPNDNTNEFTLGFWLGAGTDWTSGTLNTSWATKTSANRVSPSQVNLADSTSNDWYMTGFQLEVGTFDANSIPPFQFEDRATSLARCQRYYIRENKVATSQTISVMFTNSSTFAYGGYYFNTEMRAQPTISFSALGDFWLTRAGANVDPTAIQLIPSAVRNTALRVQVSSGLTAGEATWLRFDNDAVASPPQYLEFDSEL